MNKAKVGDMIESYTNPNNRGIITYISKEWFDAYFFASQRTETFSTTLIRQGLFKVIS